MFKGHGIDLRHNLPYLDDGIKIGIQFGDNTGDLASDDDRPDGIDRARCGDIFTNSISINLCCFILNGIRAPRQEDRCYNKSDKTWNANNDIFFHQIFLNQS